MYYVPKKNGGKRQIFHPSKETKLLQYALINTFLKKFPIHPSAMAYKEGIPSPLRKNAEVHSKYRFSLHVDFADFFPSIVPEDLFVAIGNSNYILSIEEKYILKNVLFIDFGKRIFLSVGAPSSPIISNIVMYKLDVKFDNEAVKTYNGVYTRYADDIWFSANDKDSSNNYYDFINISINSTNSPKLFLNEKKTHFCSKKKARIITGLMITPKGEVVVPRKGKRYIRALIYKNQKNGLNEKEKNNLSGYLAFIHDVEPDYLNKLYIKYGKEIKPLKK
jgi:RNA-directed DNA polymerase